jgi:D-alanyl-lipoteichoic acid acyltransferase DltB (MBOAT superfamily)
LIDIPSPEPLVNPLIAPTDQLVSAWEVVASPFGLILFAPLIPILRLVARRRPQAALVCCGLAWMAGTAGPLAVLIIAAGWLVAGTWVVTLGQLVRRRRLHPRIMIALVWLGLIAMLLPLWWYPHWSWYGWQGSSKLAVLHAAGIAYFLLRFIAWGVDLAHNPHDPLRLTDTICWLLYPPCMRLGPVLLRQDFLERLDAWNPAAPLPWKEIGQRVGLFFIGGFFLAVVTNNLPRVDPGTPDFFSSPEHYTTARLVRVLYLVPIQAYLLLWTYNELAAALSYSVGIRVDNNFDWALRSVSVREFWRRWHVTVGLWMRDYIYVPLGGGHGFPIVRLFAVFGFVAIWHGASWSFVAWGAAQALALTVQRLWDQGRKRLHARIRPEGAWWAVVCWLVTMHFAVVTILVFMDFQHCGWRILRELWQRLVETVAG